MTTLKQNYIPLGLPGLPSVKNRGALDWCHNGLGAYGSGMDVVVLDTSRLVPVMLLPSEHKFFVTMVSWNPHARPFLTERADKDPRDLVSVDFGDKLIIWDVGRCHSVSHFCHPEFKSLFSLKWSNGADVWQKTKLFLLYSGCMFVVLDVVTLGFQNILVESNPGSNELPVFDFDCEPASSTSNAIAFVGEHSVYIKNNWDPLKMKQERITFSNSVMYCVKSSSPGLHSNQDTHASSRRTGIRRLVSEMIVGADSASNSIAHGRNAASVQFHKNLSYHLVVASAREICLINIKFNVILNTFCLDRAAHNLVQVILPQKRPAVVTIHENGTVCLRKYVISGVHTHSVGLETIAASDPPRLSAKKSEVLGAVLDKYHENKILLHLSDGRFISYNIVGSISELTHDISKIQHLVTPMTPYVSSYLTVVEKKSVTLPPPPRQIDALVPLEKLLNTILTADTATVKMKLKMANIALGTLTCIKARPKGDLIVAGTSTGYILVIDIVEDEFEKRCVIKKRLSVHSNCPVSGVEFLSDSEIISFANLSFSASPKCELIMTELDTGATRVLKEDEPHHILLLRVSPLAQSLLLVYKNGMAPCELWDLERRQLIKSLPNKLPPINCAVWKESVEGVKEEVFYLTDLGTFLFTFRVDGNRFSNATCVKLDTGGNTGGVPVSLVTRGKLVFRADSSGTLVIYDTERKTASPGVPLGRGPLLKLETGTGDYSTFAIAQFGDSLELWDLTEIKRVRVLSIPKHQRALDFCWLNGCLAFIPRTSGGISCLPVGKDMNVISTEKMNALPYFFTSREKCNRLNKLINAEVNHTSLINGFKDLCLFEESEFWTIVANSMKNKTNETYITSPVSELNAYSDEKYYKEVMVKLAQCVWFCDMSKREEVAKVLLWAGELEKSAEILLDTEPSDAKKYISNGMKAAFSVGSNTLPESTKAVLKIVATNLLASGETDEGLELLCLLSKHSEAVKYVETANDWSKAILLSKSSLTKTQAHDCLSKYGHYLNSQRQVLKSASIYAYVGKFERAIEVLFGGRKRHLCFFLLFFCENHGIDLSKLSDHVKTAIRLDYARLLFDYGLMNEAIAFCDSIGEEASDLRSELEILGGNC